MKLEGLRLSKQGGTYDILNCIMHTQIYNILQVPQWWTSCLNRQFAIFMDSRYNSKIGKVEKALIALRVV